MTINRKEILLSVQRALLGAVSPALRGVTIDWDRETIRIIAFFDGLISDDDIESMSVVETEVMADFLPEYSVSMETKRFDSPSQITCLKAWAYYRKEHSSP